jgi:hypothetical protein
LIFSLPFICNKKISSIEGSIQSIPKGSFNKPLDMDAKHENNNGCAQSFTSWDSLTQVT